MKKLLLLFVLTTLFSCSDSDEPVAIPQELLGKWQYVENYQDYTEYDENGNPIRYLIDNGPTIEYKADGSFIENSGGIILTGSFSVYGNIIKRNFFVGSTLTHNYQSYSILNDDSEQMYCSPTIDQPITDEIGFFTYFRLEKRQ